MLLYELLISKGGNPHHIKRYLNMMKNFKYKDGEYTELHHILPKNLFPEYSKEKWNLLRITGRQHYLAHVCLARAFPKTDMVFAVVAMKKGGRRNNGGIHFNSHLYEKMRVEFSKRMSKRMKGVSRSVGKDNPMYGRFGKNNPQYGYKRTKEQKLNIQNSLRKFYDNLTGVEREEFLKNRYNKIDLIRWSERSRNSKLGELNPNYNKDITNSLSPEQKEKQKRNARIGMLAKMPWEKNTWTEDKDFYWSRADQLAECLLVMKPSEALQHVYNRKGVKDFNACASLIKRLKDGWDPTKSEKWVERYRSK